jgi:rhodanese-related sulfurtransferase
MSNQLLLLLGALSLVSACESGAAGSFKKLSVSEVVELQKTGSAVILDANGPDYRRENGTVPGAVLLSSAAKYVTATELPADKGTKLVFYCANWLCTASHTAAERAIEAGYRDVNVMGDGLRGWKSAGLPTTAPR